MSVAAALDRDTIRELFDIGDEAFVRDLFASYFAQAGEQLAAIQFAVANGDVRAAARAAHSLAGASLNVGAVAVAAICRAIEADPSPSPDDVRRLEQELGRVALEPLPEM